MSETATTVKVKQPYLRLHDGQVLIPNFVLEALGTPEQLELMWLKKELLMYACFGTDPELITLSPETVRNRYGGHVINRPKVLQMLRLEMKGRYGSDVFIPGFYTDLSGGGRMPGAIAQMAAFRLREAMPWADFVPRELVGYKYGEVPHEQG
jgi:hypothetical protein